MILIVGCEMQIASWTGLESPLQSHQAGRHLLPNLPPGLTPTVGDRPKTQKTCNGYEFLIIEKRNVPFQLAQAETYSLCSAISLQTVTA